MSGTGTEDRAATPPTTQRGALLDPLMAWLLTVAAIAGWWTTFAGWAWLAVGAVAAATGTVLVSMHHRRGALTWSWNTVPLAYLLLGVVVLAVGYDTGIPTPATVWQVIVGSWRCWPLLVGTHPPVDATGTVLLAPILAGILTAALCTALALGSRGPIRPLVPLVALLTLVLVTADGVSASVALLGGGFGLACLVWAVVRAGRDEAEGSGAAARWPMAIPLLVLATLVAVPLAQGLVDEPERLVLREQAAAYPVENITTPLDTFRRFRKQPEDQPDNVWRTQLLRVSGAPAGTVLRFVVLTRYDGARWVAANDVEPGRHDDRYQLFSADYVTGAEGLDLGSPRIRPSGSWSSPWLPLAGRLEHLDVDIPGGIGVDELRFNPVTSTALATRNLDTRDEYAFSFDQPATRLPDNARPSELLDQVNFDAALFLDDWARAVRADSDSRMEAVRRGGAMMKKRGRYSDGAFGWEVQFAKGHDRARLDDFFNGPRMVGNDEQYAAGMALLATRLRVPARVVVGARVPPDGVVKGNDVLAWVEVRIKDGTWRELPRASYMSFRPPKRNDPPNHPVVAPPPVPDPDPSPQPQPQPEPTPPPQPQPEPEPHPEPAAPATRWWLPLLWVLVPAAAGAIPGAKALRRLRRRRASSVSARFAGGWQELLDRARDLGLTVPAGRSRPDQAAVLGPSSAGLARVADDAVFGAEPPPEALADGYWRQVLEVRGGLSAGVPRWRRLLAPFNPASLRRTRPRRALAPLP